MYQIKKYKEFIGESMGLVAGKYDLSQVVDAIDIIMDYYKENNFIFDFNYVMTCDINNVKIDIHSSIKNNSDDVALSRTDPTSAHAHIDLYKKWFDFDHLTREIILSHEISHCIDPTKDKKIVKGTRLLYTKSFLKEIGCKSMEDFMKIKKDISKLETNPMNIKIYLASSTETEAWIGMLSYIVNNILIKNSEKLEDLKNLLRKGDWHIEKVFPELKTIMETVTQKIENLPDIQKKLLKRLGFTVNNYQETQKVKFWVNEERFKKQSVWIKMWGNYKNLIKKIKEIFPDWENQTQIEK